MVWVDRGCAVEGEVAGLWMGVWVEADALEKLGSGGVLAQHRLQFPLLQWVGVELDYYRERGRVPQDRC